MHGAEIGTASACLEGHIKGQMHARDLSYLSALISDQRLPVDNTRCFRQSANEAKPSSPTMVSGIIIDVFVIFFDWAGRRRRQLTRNNVRLHIPDLTWIYDVLAPHLALLHI